MRLWNSDRNSSRHVGAIALAVLMLAWGVALAPSGLAQTGCDATVSDGGSIQAAVDSASPGETVCVEAGTYDEAVTILVDDLRLEGPNDGTAGDSEDRDGEAVVTQGVDILADGVTLAGFEVQAEDLDAIRVAAPVSDVTIENNRITDVDGEHVFSDRYEGNGINVQPGSGTVDGLVIADNEITGVTAPDADPRVKAIDVRVTVGSSDVAIVNPTIRDNTIQDLAPSQADAGRTMGIHLDVNEGSGSIDDARIAGNEIAGLAGGHVHAIFLTETPSWVADPADPRVGPTDFAIVDNTIEDLDAAEASQALFVGGYEDLGDDHVVTENSFGDDVERWSQDQFGFSADEADVLNAPANWWDSPLGPTDEENQLSATGQTGVEASGLVDYEPWCLQEGCAVAPLLS